MRLVTSVEKTEELRQYWSVRWFDEIYNDWWHPAGSIMQGAGSGRKISLANCVTISLGLLKDNEDWDNLESIIKNTAYDVTKCASFRQGLGVDFSRLRPNGSKVLNSANQSTGAVHWMRFIDNIGNYVGQKGRIPAMLFSLNCSHPDVEEFITAKSDYTKMQNSNISVQCTEKFYKAIDNDDDWELKFEIPSLKKGDKIYIDVHSTDMKCIKEKETGKYYRIATHDRKKEIFTKTVKARKLMELIAKNMHSHAEPGIQNIDLARKYSNSDVFYNSEDEYDSRIISSNAPLTADTLIPTKCGIFSIKELYENKIHANNEGYINILCDTLSTLPSKLVNWEGKHRRNFCSFPTITFGYVSKLKKFTNQKVWEISLKGGNTLKCNAEHQWLSSGGMIKTEELKVGNKIFCATDGIVKAYNLEINKDSNDFYDGDLIGFFVGDGYVLKESRTHSKGVGLTCHKSDEYYKNLFIKKYKELNGGKDLNYFRDRGNSIDIRTENKNIVNWFESFGFKNDKYYIPEKCFTNVNFCAGFLKGLFSANGGIHQRNIILTSVDKKIITNVQILLSSWFGIYSLYKITLKPNGVKYYTKDGEKISNAKTRYDLYIGHSNSHKKFNEYIGFNGNKKKKIDDLCDIKVKRVNNRLYYEIESIKETNNVEDMYCAVVDNFQSFVVSGCISSNCSEQYLSRNSCCILSSINCGKFSSKKEIYIGQLEKIGKSINRFLDNVNECEIVHQTYATPHQELSIRKLRRTGAGATNIAAWLFKNNLIYGSKEGNEAVEDFIKWFNYWLYISVEELGKEKGDFGLFDRDKWKEAPFVKRIMEESVKLNEEFKVPILKGTHARNVTVSSIAPTGTASLMFKDFVMSYGIEPAFFMYFWKRTRMAGKYEYYFCVPHVV